MRGFVLKLAASLSRLLPAKWRSSLYRLGPMTRLIRRWLNQAAPHGRTKVHIAAGLLAGAEFQLDLQSEKDLWLGTYEAALLDRLPGWIKPAMTVYDVGANIGYLTVGFARLVGPRGEVHAFEPLPSNLMRLKQALAENDLEGRVEVVASAVAAQSGSATFLVHQSGGMGKLQGSFGRREEYQDEVEVAVISLDDYIENQAGPEPDWVKLDVEGGEGAVVAGATNLLERARPSWMIELHGPEAAAAVWSRMAAAEYKFFSVNKPRHAIKSLVDLNWKAYLVAVPREKTEAFVGLQ